MTGPFTETREEPRTTRRNRLAPMIAIVLLVALAFTVSGVFPFRQLIQQRRQVESMKIELEQLSQANEELAADVAELDGDAGIERIAREQYGLVRPGETAYIVVQPSTTEPAEETGGDLPAAVQSRSWWERVWLFVTGGDVDGDE